MGRRFWSALLATLVPLTTLIALEAAPAEAAPPATISPTSYNFGAVHIWQEKSKDFTVTVKAGHYVEAVTHVGASAFHAEQSLSCLAPSETVTTKCVITETFAPDETHDPGVLAAILEVDVCALSGGGCALVKATVKGTAQLPGSLSAHELDFGSHPAGVPSTDTIKVKPDPGVSLTMFAVLPQPGGYPPAFSTTAFTPGCVQAGSPCTATLQYDATNVGPQESTLGIRLCRSTETPGEAVCSFTQVPLTGTATPPAKPSPTSISFGTGVHVATSVTKKVTLKVLGDWHVSSVTTIGDPLLGNPFTWDWVSDCDGGGPQTCTSTTTFTPTRIGSVTGKLRFVLCAPYVDWWPFDQACTDVDVKLTGKGAAPGKVSTASLSFGSVKVGQSKTLDYKVTPDPGWSLAHVNTHTDGPTAYSSVYGICLPGQPCTVHVTFTPAYAGSTVQTGTSTPVLCREGAELCVPLPSVKLTGKGVS